MDYFVFDEFYSIKVSYLPYRNWKQQSMRSSINIIFINKYCELLIKLQKKNWFYFINKMRNLIGKFIFPCGFEFQQ